jgi:hypothetical protein
MDNCAIVVRLISISTAPVLTFDFKTGGYAHISIEFKLLAPTCVCFIHLILSYANGYNSLLFHNGFHIGTV